MTTKNIVISVVVVAILIFAGMKLMNRNGSQTNDLSRSLDKASSSIKEGVNDTKRAVEDAVD